MIISKFTFFKQKIRGFVFFYASKNSKIINFLGSNNKISEFTAILGLLELERIKKRIDKRKKLVMRYLEKLKNTGDYTVI